MATRQPIRAIRDTWRKSRQSNNIHPQKFRHGHQPGIQQCERNLSYSLSQLISPWYCRFLGLSSLSSLWISSLCKVVQSQAACSIDLTFFMFSMEMESKCCYLNVGKIHLLILVHKFDLIPSAVLRDQKADPASMNYTLSDMWRVRGYSCM